ncbi:MAG: poly(R)-hydroxyalkanoic acid synthase subunit PhaE [Paracoccaceae bacterium]
MADGHTGEDLVLRLWREGARVFAELAAAAARASEGGEADADAWGRALGIGRAWGEFLRALAASAEARAAEPGASPFDPAGWLRGAGEGGMADLWRWLEGPEFADLFGTERRAIRETAEWLRFAAALEQYRLVMARGWLAAFRRFAEALAEAEDDGGARAYDRLFALWREAADAEMARLQASDAYLAAQRDLLAAHLALRASLRARAEAMADFLGLPTRAEVDDLTETVHALGRELRRLRRQMAETGTASDGPRGGTR